jgi:hypothetical protein
MNKENPMSDPLDEPYSTLSNSLPHPTRSVVIAAEYLAEVVAKDMGVRSGKTALYWHLIYVIQEHAGKREKGTE